MRFKRSSIMNFVAVFIWMDESKYICHYRVVDNGEVFESELPVTYEDSEITTDDFILAVFKCINIILTSINRKCRVFILQPYLEVTKIYTLLRRLNMVFNAKSEKDSKIINECREVLRNISFENVKKYLTIECEEHFKPVSKFFRI